MMVLANPMPHQSFEAESFHRPGSASDHAEFPPPSLLPLPPRQPQPFPATLQHAHTSPYPMTQSFSALGPPEAPTSSRGPGGNAAPPAPRAGTIALPRDSGDINVQQPLPPTPEPSPPTSKHLSPVAMVALAPPAEDTSRPVLQEVDSSLNTESSENSDTSTPRRLPAVSIDTNVPIPGPPSAESSDSASSMKRGKLPRSDSQPAMSRTASGGRAKSGDRRARPRRQNTAIPAVNAPSSARMIENRSAEARARLRSGGAMMTRYHTTVGTGYSSAQSSPGLSRALTDAAPTPPRSIPVDLAPPDLGGPDGLEAKVVLLGSQGVGKTSLILRYTSGKFALSPAPATIGNSLYTRKLVYDHVRVKLQIWDTAGQERFRSMAPIYYRGAHVCVLVYDISDRTSFEDVKSWLDELARTVPKETVIYVVGAKLDLEKKRAVSYSEARRTLRSWLRPPEPEPVVLAPQPSRSIFRSASGKSRPDSLLPTPTPVRSHSFHALASVEAGTAAPPSSRTSYYPSSQVQQHSPAPRSPAVKADQPSTRPKSIILNSSAASIASGSGSVPFPALKVTSPTSPRSPNRVSFPALQSPSKPTSATFTEPIRPSITSSAQVSRHGVSGGRFSISDVLGITRSPSMSGAVSNLAQLAEANPVSPDRRRRHDSLAVPPSARLVHPAQSSSPSRVRTESSPLFPSGALADNPRRKSEDWSGRGWRLGEGPGVAGTLEEFGVGVRRKGSADMGAAVSSTASGFVKKSAAQSQSSAAGGVQGPRGRARGGSLGRDSRLYGNEPPRASSGPRSGGSGGIGASSSAVILDDRDEDDETDDWGVEVEGVRIGECSALTGEGVEALFRSISAVLVGRKDKIERERTLRHKNSVMLTDPTDDTTAGSTGGSKSTSRQACCV